MIEKFQHYLDDRLARKVEVDREEAKSLMNKAVLRLDYIKKQEINEDTSSFIFEDIYETLREASQSLMSLKGYWLAGFQDFLTKSGYSLCVRRFREKFLRFWVGEISGSEVAYVNAFSGMSQHMRLFLT